MNMKKIIIFILLLITLSNLNAWEIAIIDEKELIISKINDRVKDLEMKDLLIAKNKLEIFKKNNLKVKIKIMSIIEEELSKVLLDKNKDIFNEYYSNLSTTNCGYDSFSKECITNNFKKSFNLKYKKEYSFQDFYNLYYTDKQSYFNVVNFTYLWDNTFTFHVDQYIADSLKDEIMHENKFFKEKFKIKAKIINWKINTLERKNITKNIDKTKEVNFNKIKSYLEYDNWIEYVFLEKPWNYWKDRIKIFKDKIQAPFWRHIWDIKILWEWKILYYNLYWYEYFDEYFYFINTETPINKKHEYFWWVKYDVIDNKYLYICSNSTSESVIIFNINTWDKIFFIEKEWYIDCKYSNNKLYYNSVKSNYFDFSKLKSISET